MTVSPSAANDRSACAAALEASQRLDWRLGFGPGLETDFQAHYATRYRDHMRLGLAIGAVAMVVSVFEDFLVPPGERLMPFLIRFGLVLPVVCLLFFLIQRPALARWQQSILMLSTLGGATAFLMMAFFVTSPVAGMYINTLMLIQIFGLMLLRMQFGYAVPSFLLIAAGSTFVLLFFPFTGSGRDHLVELMLIVFAGLLCLVGNYLMERSARMDYLQQRLLEFGQRDLEAINSHLQLLLRSDALTGISNRRHFDTHLVDEFRRAERGNYPLALLMVDVDCFKLYNDTYGHQAGDEALTRVARTLSEFARRPGDVAARYGGEEFALILPGSTEEDALAIADGVVADVFAQALPHKSSRVSDRVTVSIGVASVRPGEGGVSEETLVACADQALYLAKKTGRNRARSWSSL